MELTGFGYAGSCREYSHLAIHAERMDSRRYKNWTVLEVKDMCHLYQCGIEIKIDSMKNDGSQSWIVSSRGKNKYVNELPEENEKSIHCEEVTTGTVKPVAA